MEGSIFRNTTNTDDAYCYFCDSTLWVIFKLAFGGIVVTLNTVSLVGLLRYKELIRSLKYSFTILSFSGTLLGISYLYGGLVSVFKNNYDTECKIRMWFLGMGSFLALSTVALLSFDRFVSLEFPLKYTEFATKKVFLAITCICWALIFTGVTWVVSEFRDFIWCDILDLLPPQGVILMTMCGLLVIVVTVVFNLRIFVLARRQISKILPTILGDDRAASAIRLNTKTIVTTAAVLLPFVLCNIPLYICFLVFLQRPDLIAYTIVPDILDIVLFLQLLNSCLNPLIYIWRLPELKHHLKTMVTCHVR